MNTHKDATRRNDWPVLTPPTRQALYLIGDQLNIPNAGLQLAADRGLLRVGMYQGSKVYAITDEKRSGTHVFKMDGKPFPCGRASVIVGSTRAIGVDQLGSYDRIMLVEFADVLAAHAAIAREEAFDCCAVAAERITPAEASRFAGKHVRIFPSITPASRALAAHWIASLKPVAGQMDRLHFEFLNHTRVDGRQIESLADLQFVDPAVFDTVSDCLALCPKTLC